MVQKKASTQTKNKTADKDGQRINPIQDDAYYSVVEDLFNNYSSNTPRIMFVNFLRGVSFGLGSVIGGTVGIATLVWLLSFFVHWPFLGEAIESFLQILTKST